MKGSKTGADSMSDGRPRDPTGAAGPEIARGRVRRLAVSNIAWGGDALDPKILKILRRHGVEGIEAAPGRLWPDRSSATLEGAREWARRHRGEGFSVPAMQALLFGVQGAAIFGTRAEEDVLASEISKVCALGAALGAKALVFGSPGLRNPVGMEPDAVRVRASEVFRRLGGCAAAEGVVLVLEANPPAYGCSFLTTLADAAAFVAELDAPGLGLHLDAGQLAMSEPDPAESIASLLPRCLHLHASQPNLGRFQDPSEIHAPLASALVDSPCPSEWISLEMRRDESDVPGAIAEALAALRRIYAPALHTRQGAL